jgi:hypothetical protein
MQDTAAETLDCCLRNKCCYFLLLCNSVIDCHKTYPADRHTEQEWTIANGWQGTSNPPTSITLANNCVVVHVPCQHKLLTESIPQCYGIMQQEE